ncbi:MAG: hypothetical protein CSA39_01650 [Flavobacteriales bacterium]|nr:MAG: hypothetical protein CSA39_01650 [Flavobacteriales bacterium]
MSFMALVAIAQVKDISFTLSPTAEYTLWDDKAGIEDNFLVGGKLGFGFGEYVELRALYLQSLNTKTSFKDFGIAGYDGTLFNPQDLTITRWGGEFKANLGTKGIKPYFTLGAGVQNIDVDNGGDFEQVYGSLGLGAKFNLGKRIVLGLEAKNTTYKFNAGANLLSDDDKTDFGVTNADFESERLSNWSVQASLQFYLGGRTPGTLSALDRAYLQQFKGGFKGLRWVIEPSMAYVDFNDESVFRDTYWLGGYAGLDFNEYIGLRAFYFQSTKNEEISTDFDKMAMYGAEFRARLNNGKGVTPFLILGGGYLNPSSNYVPIANADGTFPTVEGGEFATGGLGLNIPLGKHLLITGGARAMITSGENVTDITNTDNIQTHIFYNAGLKFTLGKKSASPQTVYQENLDAELEAQQAVNNAKIEQLKKEYQAKITGLENELQQAYAEKDVEKAVEILEEKKETEEALAQVEAVEKVQQTEVKQQAKVIPSKTDNIEIVQPELKTEVAKEVPITQSRLIKMTPEEFESLIQRILKNLDETEAPKNNVDKQTTPSLDAKFQDNLMMEQLNKRIELLEKLLLQINSKQGAGITTEQKQEDVNNLEARKELMNTAILDKLEELNRKIDANTDQIKASQNAPKAVVVTPIQNEKGETIITTIDEKGKVENTSNLEGTELNNQAAANDTLAKEPNLKYKHTSAMLGFNYGGASTANFGLRLHYGIAKTKLEFMPEAYLGFGEANAWAISGNAVYPFPVKSEKVLPYAGAGLGLGNFVNSTTAFYNIIIGARLPILHKNLYIDYTMRNTFKYNQLAIGYCVKF